jgi:hypothetical protein
MVPRHYKSPPLTHLPLQTRHPPSYAIICHATIILSPTKPSPALIPPSTNHLDAPFHRLPIPPLPLNRTDRNYHRLRSPVLRGYGLKLQHLPRTYLNHVDFLHVCAIWNDCHVGFDRKRRWLVWVYG